LLQSNTNSYPIVLQVWSEPACMMVLPFTVVLLHSRGDLPKYHLHRQARASLSKWYLHMKDIPCCTPTPGASVLHVALKQPTQVHLFTMALLNSRNAHCPFIREACIDSKLAAKMAA